MLKIPSANIFEAVLIELRAATTDLAKSVDVAVSRMVLRSILTAASSGLEKPSMPQRRFEQASILERQPEQVGQESTLT